MRLKWQTRPLGASGKGSATKLVAQLVEARRKNGATMESVVANLGSIDTRFLKINIPNTREFHQGLFWVSVEKELNRVKLSAEETNKITQAIAQRVPRPGDDWALWGVTCIPRFDP